MAAKKMTAKERLVETIISEMKERTKNGQISEPIFFEGWEEYRKRIGYAPIRSLRAHLTRIRAGKDVG